MMTQFNENTSNVALKPLDIVVMHNLGLANSKNVDEESGDAVASLYLTMKKSEFSNSIRRLTQKGFLEAGDDKFTFTQQGKRKYAKMTTPHAKLVETRGLIDMESNDLTYLVKRYMEEVVFRANKSSVYRKNLGLNIEAHFDNWKRLLSDFSEVVNNSYDFALELQEEAVA